MIGQIISQYKILEKLGEGGMGVVYKATDTKLNRTVAMKFLPDRVNKDETAKARFIQEAQAAAGLNHPNICTIYGVEEFEGPSSADTPAFKQLCMVMEFVEGGTLAAKIPFAKIDDAVTAAMQIADALQEAHAKGIVHRDIKADNIMLSSKGQAKVMDFGLAKLKGAMKLTRTSSTVGTLGYMAPEQIQGGEVDHRSDIFSFGVLLFEMLAGKLPFRGEHEAAMVYSIVNEEPQNITQILPDLSPIVVNLINRCLEKEPAERYQHFDDITADLKRALRKTSKVMRSSPDLRQSPSQQMPTEGTSGVHPKPGMVSSMSVRILLIILVVLAAAAGVWKFMNPSLPAVNQNMTTSVLQIPATEYQYPDMSPDGKWLVFPGSDVNGKWDIYLMFIENGESRRLTNDSAADLGNAATARFSLDGSSIVYSRIRQRARSAEVCVVSVLTGTTRVVADSGLAPTWGPKGDRIYFYRSGNNGRASSASGWREYWSVSPQGTDQRIEFIDSLMQGSLNYFTMKISPDGKKFLFTRPMKGDFNEIIIRDLTTGEERQLTHDQKTIDEGIWAENGYILYSSNRSGNFNIWAIPESGGESIQITRGGGPDFGISYSVTANRLIFSQRTETSTLWMVNTNGTDNHQVFPDDNISQAHLSPNGKTLALQIMNSSFYDGMMIRDIAGGRQEILAPFNPSKSTILPLWSPSGTLLSYAEFSEKNGTQQLHAKVNDIAGGRQVIDLGKGIVDQWISDSTVLIIRSTSGNDKNLNLNETHVANIYTGEDKVFFRDSTFANALLNNSAVLYPDSSGNSRIVSRNDLVRDPKSEGTILLRGDETGAFSVSQSYVYYTERDRGTLWKLDVHSLIKTKILDLSTGDNIVLDKPSYSDSILTYTKHRRKTNIVKIDKLFAE